jgi:hypothetical protein
MTGLGLSFRFCALLLIIGAGTAFGLGPDAGGYRAIDSDTVGGASFQWIDIAGTGTPVQLGDDDNQGPFALGFTFDFYGTEYDSVRICSNGWLSFLSNSHQYHHYHLPDSRVPNALVAALWADLDPSAGGSVLYLSDTALRRFIVTWSDVPFHGSSDSCTFQVILDSSGTVLCQYRRLPLSVPAGIDSCSVGIENGTGLVGLEYLFDGAPAGNALHDSQAVRFFRVQRDVCPVAVQRPLEQVLALDSIVPLVQVWNSGRSPAAFSVTLRISDGYEQRVDVSDLASLADTVVRFPTWAPVNDTYQLEFFTDLAEDEFPGNDTIRVQTSASFLGELRYDDGAPDTWFLKVGPPSQDWAALVCFSPPYAEYRLLSARIFVGDTMPFRRVLVCPDSSGAPRLSRPYLVRESAAATEPQSWLELGADTLISTGSPIWLVAFWPGRVSGPRIGEDRTGVLDRHSYFGTPSVRWIPYPYGDLMMRLRIDGRTGISEREPSSIRPLRFGPNPFSRQVAFSGPDRFSIQVFATDGTRVAELAARHGTAAWSPVKNPRGVYFAKIRLGAGSSVVKLLYVE